MSRFRDLFGLGKPIIGVLHLPALPGYPQSPGLDAVLDRALSDTRALVAGGAAGILVENQDDAPKRVLASPEAIAVLTRVTRCVVEAAPPEVVVGVEFLLNDPRASLAVAKAAGARFIRTDYFVDPMERPEHGGAMEIDPVGWLAYRAQIAADDVLVLADIQVKYARMLVARSLTRSAELAVLHRADGIIVTGRVTGDPPLLEHLRDAKAGAGPVPVLIGSGLDAANAGPLLALADGAVVGTSLKQGPGIDPVRVAALVSEARRASEAPP
jgi:hypothetical protein